MTTRAAELIGRSPDTASWRDDVTIRETFLGGSDAAAALGIDPYRSPVALWLEKLGRGDGFAGNNATDWGHRLEPVIADWYADTHPDVDVIDPGGRTWRHPVRAWQACTPDRLAVHPDRDGFGVVQIKTAGWRVGGEWDTGDAPDHYRAQLLHEIDVCGASWGQLVCLVAGRDPYVVDQDRDDDLIGGLISAEARFWAAVESRVEPILTGHRDEAADLARVWVADPDDAVDLDGTEGEDALLGYLDAVDQIGRLEQARDRHRAVVEMAMGPATVARVRGGAAVTWRARTEVDVDRLTVDHPDAVTDASPPKFSATALTALHPGLAREYRRIAGRTFRVTATTTDLTTPPEEPPC